MKSRKQKQSVEQKKAAFLRYGGYSLLFVSLIGAFTYGFNSWVLAIYIIGTLMVIGALYYRIRDIQRMRDEAVKKKKIDY